MTTRDFTFWCHGWAEINGGSAPTATQWQVILDHLDLVRREQAIPAVDRMVAANTVPIKGRDGRPSCPDTATKSPPAQIAPQSTTTTSLVVPSGLAVYSGPSGWADWERSQNQGKVFITVAPEPIYDSKTTYSFYQYAMTGQSVQRSLVETYGIDPGTDKVYLVIDNALKPTQPTYADHMRGGGNHLTMLSRSGPGIINVGTGPSVYC